MNIKMSFLLHCCILLFLPNVMTNVDNNLRHYLFKNYSSFTIPVKDPNTCLNVTFNMKLMRLLSVEEKNQNLISQAYFGMKWRNEFLTWEPKDWQNTEYLAVNPDMVWIPDIILKNNAGSEAVTTQKGTDKVFISHTGETSWHPKVMIISSFKADVTYFPFDDQDFTFHFGSWSLGADRLQIIKNDKPIIDIHYLNGTEWKLERMRKEIVLTTYHTDTYTDILFTYRFSRKPGYCVISAIIPSIGLMSIALFSYLLPPRRGERIKVLITSLLAFIVLLVEINGSLPRNSDSIPTIQVFYMVTMGECMLCFFTTCLLVRLLENCRNDTPAWVKKYIIRGKSHAQNKYSNISVKTKKKENESFPLADQIGQISSAIRMCRKCNLVDILKKDAIAKNKIENADAVTWEIIVKYIDNTCLIVFSLLFFTTTIFILANAYYRKNH